MDWLIPLSTIIYFLNEHASSWSLPTSPGQVSCDSPEQCLLNSPPIETKPGATPSRYINTWYPVPKWKVFFDLRLNRSQQYSQPYFSKQNLEGTSGNIQDNDFSSVPNFKEEKIGVSETLNFRFLPLKDGNITVKDLEVRVNPSSEEYVALFAVYAQSVTKYKPGSSVSVSKNQDLQTESKNQKVNGKFCNWPDECKGNVSKTYQEITDLSAKNITSKGEKIVEIPVTKNMSIEMNIGELDNDTYTVVIMPFDKAMTASDVENGRVQLKSSESMNVTLSKNMSMVMKAEDILLNYKTPNNESEKEDFYNMNISNESIRNHAQSLKNKNESSISLNRTYDKDVDNVTKNLKEIKDYFDYEGFDGESNIMGTFPTTVEYNDSSKKKNLTSDVIDPRNKNNLKSTDARVNMNNSLGEMTFFSNASSEEFNKNILENALDNLKQQNKNLNGRLQIPSTDFNTSANHNPHSSDLREVEFYQRLGPYEVRELNSNQLPFIATFHITVNNRGKGNKTTYMIHLAASQKINSTENRKNNVANQTVDNGRVSSKPNRRKRSSASNEYPLAWQKSYQRINSVREEEIINDKFVSRESSEVDNKYPSRTIGMILNKTEGTSSGEGAINLSDLISTGASEKEQIVISQLRKGFDSYSAATPTISNGNEEFNQQNFNDKFRYKGITESETLDNTNGDGGIKSNQTLHGDHRNKGEVALPAVIPSPYPGGENHSAPKKSELQIGEKASPMELVVDWGMKILPGGVGVSKGNGIKAGKICHVENDCKEMNGVFNAMEESKYYKVDYEKKRRFFSSGVNADAKGGGIDKKDVIESRRFQRETRGRPMSLETKRSEEKLEKRSILGPRSFTFNSRLINNMKGQLSPLMQSDVTPPHTVKSLSETQRLKSKHSDVNSVYKEQSLRDEYRLHREYKKSKEYFNESQSKVSKSPRNLVKPKSKKQLRQSSFQQQNFRKKRFASEFFPTKNNRNTFSSSSSNTQDNFSPTTYENNNERQQNFAPILLQSNLKQNGRIPSTDNRRLYNEPISDPRPDSTWNIRSETPIWTELNHDEKTFPGKFSSDFPWVMIEPVNAKPTRIAPTTQSTTDKMMEGNNGQSNQERERNEYEWPNYDWVLIDPVREQGDRKKVNTNNPSTEKIPFGIINRPNQNPNIRTTTRTTRKPVFRTTNNPKKTPDYFSTHKPAEIPSFQTTVKPWFFNNPWDQNKWNQNKWDQNKWDQNKWNQNKWDLNKWDLNKWDQNKWDLNKWDLNKWDQNKWDQNKWDQNKWDQNLWSVSYNPWKNQFTTPMTMVGGMGGGD